MSKKLVEIQEGQNYLEIGGLVKRLVHPKITGSENLGMSIAYLHPGEKIKPHSHNFEEAYFVLQGKGEMTIDGEVFRLKKNLSVYIPRNSVHTHINDGDEPLITICALSPPPPSS